MHNISMPYQFSYDIIININKIFKFDLNYLNICLLYVHFHMILYIYLFSFLFLHLIIFARI